MTAAPKNTLFYGALAFSAAAHLLLILLLPGPSGTPPRSAREYFPVTLVRPPPAAAAAPQTRAQPPIQAQPAPQAQPAATSRVQASAAPARLQPEQAEPVPTPAEQAPVQGAVTAPAAAPQAAGPATGTPTQTGSIAATTPESAAQEAGSAEAAAVTRILSELRASITAQKRYPPLARSRGWQGTAVIVARLDAAGGLLEAVLRRSSGYEVLDRAALALIRKVFPVANPLGRPVSIEIPITYQLR
jgi:protein TonB